MICTLHRDHPENTEMPPSMLLEHFLNCMDRQRQESLLAELRTQAQVGNRCWMTDHESLARYVSYLQQVQRNDQAYIRSLVGQLRELLSDAVPLNGVSWVSADRLQAILERTKAQSVEQVDP